MLGKICFLHKAFLDKKNKARRLDLLRKWVLTQDVKECTVSLIVTDMRKQSSKTRSEWLSRNAVLSHYFGDVDRTNEVAYTMCVG